MRFVVCATQGSGGDDEARLRALVSNFDATVVQFSKQAKLSGALGLLRQLKSRNFDLFVLEGSGVAGGLAAVLGRILWGMPYVVSSGDSVGPYLTARYPLGKPLFFLYEKLLCASASGFVGWTPYLVGRALTYGSPRGITIPGWAPYEPDKLSLQVGRQKFRAKLNIPEDAVVFGIVGAITWSRRYSYCYGMELVKAARLAGPGAYVLIVGDGSGLDRLREMAGGEVGSRIILAGRVPRNEVSSYLAALDVGSIPQSVDGVGNFRYSTKLSEYKAVGLPFVTTQIPMSYDLDDGSVWRLPGKSPWDPVFIHGLANLMKSLTPSAISERLAKVKNPVRFEREVQIRRVTEFLKDVVETERRVGGTHP